MPTFTDDPWSDAPGRPPRGHLEDQDRSGRWNRVVSPASVLALILVGVVAVACVLSGVLVRVNQLAELAAPAPQPTAQAPRIPVPPAVALPRLAPVSAPVTGALGTRFEVTTPQGQLLRVSAGPVASGARSASRVVQDTNGSGFVTVDVELQYVGGGLVEEFLSLETPFTLVTGDGVVHEAVFLLGNEFPGVLRFADLAPGQTAAGKIAFDLPAAAVSGASVRCGALGGPVLATWT